MHLARKSYSELSFAAVSIQSGMRGMASRDEIRFQRENKAAIMIQVVYMFLVESCEEYMFSFLVLVHLLDVAGFSCSSQFFCAIYDIEFVLFVYNRVIAANSWPCCTSRG